MAAVGQRVDLDQLSRVVNPLFCQLVADACGLPVVAGPTEAASWGNVLVQARALDSARTTLPELRSLILQGVHLAPYQPQGPDQSWDRADEIVLSSRRPLNPAPGGLP